MRILFITPPNFRFRGVRFGNLPFGPAYLCSVLRARYDVYNYYAELMSTEEINRHSDTFREYSPLLDSHGLYLAALAARSHPVWREIQSVLENLSPDVVGLSTMTCSYPSALVIAEMVKKVTNAKLIVGGVHATTLPDEVASNQYVDFVVRGEAEVSLAQLLEHIEKGTEPCDVAGITYRKGGRTVSTPDACLIENLSTLPLPDIETVVFPGRYSSTSFSTILAGRGCPARCHFCANHVLWRKRHRMRSIDSIYEEVLWKVKRYGKTIDFGDDNLMVSRKVFLELCERMHKEIPDILWRCQSRVDTVTAEKVRASKEAGCWDIKLGIESGSDRILKYLNKRQTVDQTLRCCEMIMNNGVQVSVNFMFGFPEETWDDMQLTLQMIREICASSIAVSKFIPLPGTKLFDDVVELGIFGDRAVRYEHLDLFSTYYHYPRYVSRERFQEFYWEIHRVVDEKNRRTRTGPPKLG